MDTIKTKEEEEHKSNQWWIWNLKTNLSKIIYCTIDDQQKILETNGTSYTIKMLERRELKAFFEEAEKFSKEKGVKENQLNEIESRTFSNDENLDLLDNISKPKDYFKDINKKYKDKTKYHYPLHPNRENCDSKCLIIDNKWNKIWEIMYNQYGENNKKWYHIIINKLLYKDEDNNLCWDWEPNNRNKSAIDIFLQKQNYSLLTIWNNNFIIKWKKSETDIKE